MQLYIGCSGWSYTSWQGPFYPTDMNKNLQLPFYSEVFNYVEIDSTFYNIPTESMVRNWNKRTPDNFRFTVKFPKVITHDKRLMNAEKELSLFYDRMEPLKGKILALIIQLPPSFELKEGLESLRRSDFFFDDTFRYAIEVRHRSWFNELAYNLFQNSNISLAWSQMDRLQTPPIVTTDFIYLRLIGDRSIHESNFGKLQIDRKVEMEKWAEKIKETKNNEKNIKTAIVVANNHYGGFGPGTVNIFREMMDMNPIDVSVDMKKLTQQIYLEKNFDLYNRTRKKENQTTISDFI
ncbi:MAG: DUF72 domain-containing protein [Nitrososphaeraceae archaeon]